MSGDTRHPRGHVGCAECGSGSGTWTETRKLPQVGQTYECSECAHEVYVYDAGDCGETLKQWRPVTQSMATNLLFFDEVGEWPDSALDELFKEGIERMAAVDYHITEVEGLSQSAWADRTRRSQPTVSENVAKASSKLNP